MARTVPYLRVAFLVAVALFAWLSLRGRFDEVGDALGRIPPAGILGALALVLLGLLATGLLWLRLMASFDARLGIVDGLALFFVGQLGKYIPGSVWSIGAQAEMARRHQVPPRVTVSTGLVFLGYHVDTAVLLASGAAIGGALDPRWPDWLSWAGLALGLIGLAPAFVRTLAARIGGRAPRLTFTDTAIAVALMAVAWLTYAAALVLLAPDASWGDLGELGGAFAAAYAVGVVVVFAPAGVGAREATFVVLLTPLLGVGPATALALVARVVHTAADALLAGLWWSGARRVAGNREGLRH